MAIKQELSKLFSQISERPPLVHHITNVVTVNDCANATLSMGGKPVMADSPEEARDMAEMASSLVINIGTLSVSSNQAMIEAGEKATEKEIPIILDPVGAGATDFRTKQIQYLLKKTQPAVICGNMSEMLAIAGLESNGKGVDSGDRMEGARELAERLAKDYQTIIAITGPEDVISDGKQTYQLTNGNEWLSRVTGTGCMTTSLIGVFAGATQEYLTAAVAGVAVMGLAGETAFASLKEGEGIGTFKMRLFDALSLTTDQTLEKGMKLNALSNA